MQSPVPIAKRAFYRLMLCEEMSRECILAAHRTATIEKALQVDSLVLIIHDTSEYESMFEHAQNHETMTFYELAEELGTTPADVERRFRKEAEDRGQLDYFLRSALLRQLYHYVPNGVRSHGDWKLTRALSSWIGMVGTTRDVESYCKKVGDAIQNDDHVATDWLPSTANDPAFLKYFQQ